MKTRIALLLIILLLAGASPGAQTIGKPVLAGPATLNASSASCLATNCLSINLGGYSAISIQISGVCGTCTAQFEETLDGTWVAVNLTPPNSAVGVSSTAAAGVWQGAIIARSLRVRLSAWASGSWTVSLRAVQSM